MNDDVLDDFNRDDGCDIIVFSFLFLSFPNICTIQKTSVKFKYARVQTGHYTQELHGLHGHDPYTCKILPLFEGIVQDTDTAELTALQGAGA